MKHDEVESVLNEVLSHAAEYDPAARRLRYLRERELKGRRIASSVKGSNTSNSKLKVEGKEKNKLSPKELASLKEQVSRIRSRLSKLRDRLREIETQSREKSNKSNSKLTAAEKSKAARASKKYRDQNKTKIAQKRRQEASAKEQSKSISNMNEAEVRTAIKRTLVTLKKAMAKVKAANQRTA